MNSSLSKLRNVTKIKMIFMISSIIIPILLVSILQPLADEIGENISWFPIFLRYFIFVGAIVVIVFKLSDYTRILKNEDYANHVLVKRKDERLIFLKSKTYRFSYKLALYMLTVALIVISFIDVYIFFTLLIIFACMWIILFFTNIYYNKKY